MKFLKLWFPGFIVGFGAATVAAFVQADRIRVSGQLIYFGLILAPLFLLVTQRWLMSHYQNRISGIAFATAWLLVSIRLAIPNAGGDLALSATWYSTAYLGASAVLLSMSMVIRPKPKLYLVD
jgi:hypothetical protein